VSASPWVDSVGVRHTEAAVADGSAN
jgi:hypothetical protein